MLNMLRTHGWRGYLQGMGAAPRLPLLTRLAGGMNAWSQPGGKAVPNTHRTAGADPGSSAEPAPSAAEAAGPAGAPAPAEEGSERTQQGRADAG